MVTAAQITGSVSIQGADTAKTVLLGVGKATDTLQSKLSSFKPFNVGNSITGLNIAEARLNLLEVQVQKARDKLQTLQNAANAGEAVTGIPEATAKLALLEARAQQAREKFQQLGLAALQASQQIVQSTASPVSALQRIGEVASSAFSRLGEAAASAIPAILRIGQAAVETSFSFMGGIRSMLGGLLEFGSKLGFAVFGIQQLIQTAEQLGSAFLKPNADMEQTTIAFTGILRSSRAANDMIRNLWSFASRTPFLFPNLAKDTQMLLGMGFAAKDVIPVLTAAGDAASAMGRGQEGIDRITLALGQMQARGKVTGQDMLQITEAGIPAWRILAESMHLTVAQVQKLSETGQLGAESVTMLWHGMEKLYGGQMKNQALTFNGLLTTFKDNITAAWRAFTGPLFDKAKGALTSLGTLVSGKQFQDFAKMLGQNVGNALNGLISLLSQVAGAFNAVFFPVQQIQKAIAPLTDAFDRTKTGLTSLKGVLGPITDAFDRTKTGLSGMNPVVQTLTDAFDRHSGALKTVAGSAKGATNPFVGFFQALKTGIDFVRKIDWGTIMHGLQTIASAAAKVNWGAIFQGIGTGIERISAIIQQVSAALSKVDWGTLFKRASTEVQGLASAFMVVWGVISRIDWGGIFNSLIPVVQGVGSFLRENFLPVWQQMQTTIQSQLIPAWNDLRTSIEPLMPTLTMIAEVIGGILLVALGELIALLAGIIGGFAGFLTGMMQVFGGIVQIISGTFQIIAGLVSFIVDLCTGHFERLGADLAAVWRGIVNVTMGAWNVTQGIINAGTGLIIGFVSGFVGTLIHWFQFLYHAIVGGSIIPDMVNGILNWFNNLVNRGIAFITSLVARILAAMVHLEVMVLSTITLMVTMFLSWLDKMTSGGVTRALSLASRVLSAMNTLKNNALTAIGNMVSSLLTKFDQMVSSAASKAQSLVDKVMSTLGQLPGKARNAGVALVQGIINGIQSMLGALGDMASNIASTIGSFLPHSPAKRGELAHLNEYGPNFVKGFAEGITKSTPRLQASLDLMMKPVASTMAPSSSFSGRASPYQFPSMATASPTVVVYVQPPDVNLDGYPVAKRLLPHTVQLIRQGTGVRF